MNHEEFDPITTTKDGRVIWKRYDGGRPVVTAPGQVPESTPAKVVERNNGIIFWEEAKTMTNKTELTELLKRAATILGELLIDDQIDADQITDAKALHDDLMAVVLAQESVPTCNKTWYLAGGRVERTCGEIVEPDAVCAECGAARCAEHDDLGFEEIDGRILCEDCQSERR
jgi:hypothetical protein